MKKQIMLILGIIFLMGIISAEVTITPSVININTFPGETHSVNITIKADGNYLVVFNSTNPDISISPSSIQTINGEFGTVINLTFSKDISAGIHTFDVKGGTEVMIIPSSTCPSSYVKKCNKCVNNTIFYPIENKTECEEEKEQEEPITVSKNEKEEFSLIPLIVLGVFGAVGVALIIYISFKIKNKE